MSSITGLITLCAAMAFWVGAAPASAQGSSGGSSPAAAAAMVTVIQAADMPAPGGRAVIVRRASGTPRDVIVLPASGATAADLASALAILARARAHDNDELPAPQQRISIKSADFSGAQSPEATKYFEAQLRRLSNAPTIDVPGVARGRGIVLPQNRVSLD